MRMLGGFLLGAVAMIGLAAPALAAERAVIVLDGSGSMWAQIDGTARITIARETLSAVLADLPDDLELGFMTYGHRKKGDCTDIEMLVEPAIGTGAAITQAAEAISPKGMTPISDAVRLAAENLRFTEEKATVILITDGLETCEVDPCALASELETQGVDFTTHVLGFGLSDAEGQQVACLAENTGGQYLPAGDGAALVEALTRTVTQVAQAAPAPAPEPEPAPEPAPEPVAAYNLKPTISLSEGGPDIADDTFNIVWSWYKRNADGSTGDFMGQGHASDFEGTLEPGDYILKLEIGHAEVSQPITIKAGEVQKPHFVVNGTIVKLRPKATSTGAIEDDTLLDIDVGGEYVGTEYGEVINVIPAGEVEVEVVLGDAKTTRSYSAKAGETIDEDIILNAGTFKIVSQYVEGTPVEADIFIEIFEAKKNLEGNRQSAGYKYGGQAIFTLVENDYVAIYTLDGATAEIAFSIMAGEVTEIDNVMNAGILAVATPTDNYVEIFGITKNLEGNRQSFDYGYGPEFTSTLTAGDYIVATTVGDVKTETPVTIAGGERFELTVEAPKAGKKK